DRFDLEAVAEVLLGRALDEELRRRGQLVAVAGKDERREPATELGAVDALTGVREEHLLDEVAEMSGLGGRRRPTAAPDVERMVDVHGEGVRCPVRGAGWRRRWGRPGGSARRSCTAPRSSGAARAALPRARARRARPTARSRRAAAWAASRGS